MDELSEIERGQLTKGLVEGRCRMEQLASIVDAVAALLWPLLVLFVFIRFAPALNELISSARSRKFTLKVGGHELSMEEVRAQQSDLIADLQNQVAALREMMKGPGEETPATLREERGANNLTARSAHTAPRVLWVDDQPKNNSYYVEQLTKGGVEVDLALDTADGLRRFENKAYRVVISDIGRKEGSAYNRDAGLDLLRNLRESSEEVSVALFTSSSGVKHRGVEASELGADLVTDSGTELVQFLRRNLPEWEN